MTRDRKRYFILAVLTLSILLALFFDARAELRTILNPDWPVVLFAASLTILFPFCMALRWAAILWAARRPVRLTEAAAATMAVWPLGTITPSKTGDLAKALCVRDKVPLAEGLGSVVTERALDVIVLLLFSFVGGLKLGHPAIAAFAGIGLACALAGWTIVALGFRLPVGEKWSERLQRFGETSRGLLKRPDMLALASAAAGANWLLSIWQTQLLYRAFGVDVPFLFVCAALPIAIFIGLLPITLAGAGTRDKALMVLFVPFAAEGVSLSVGVLYTVCGYILPSLAGLPFMRRLIVPPGEETKK